MKKEKMKQICNYFMKGLLLCALVFGFWFMADAGVNAMEHGINIDRTGNVELIPLTQKDTKLFECNEFYRESNQSNF